MNRDRSCISESVAACKTFAEKISQIVSQVRSFKGRSNRERSYIFPASVVGCRCFAGRVRIISQVSGGPLKVNATGKGLRFQRALRHSQVGEVRFFFCLIILAFSLARLWWHTASCLPSRPEGRAQWQQPRLPVFPGRSQANTSRRRGLNIR